MSKTERKPWWKKNSKGKADDAQVCNGNCLLLTSEEIAEHESLKSNQIIADGKPKYTGEKRWHVVDKAIEVLTDHSLLSFSKLYQPLSCSQTRLVKIPPKSSTKSDLKISLITLDVSSQGLRQTETREVIEYTALSYSWKDLRLTKQIHCNDLPIHIPLNLHAAILHHQKSDISTFLWVDAICINQDDAQEKAAQVAMMMDIYLKAQSVTAWLGLPDERCRKAIDCIRDANRLKTQLTTLEHTIHTPACHQAIQVYFSTLLSLYEQPYLSRTWIRQETFAGNNIMVVCGRTKLRWQYFVRLGTHILFHLKAVADPEDTKLQARYSAIAVLLLEAQLTPEGASSLRQAPRKLSEVLLRSQYFGVSNEVDTVYATLAMCGVAIATDHAWSPSHRAFLVDYTRSSEQVYHDLSMWMIIHNQAAFLSAWTYCVKQGNKSLPSWVIDWRVSPSNDPDIAALEQIEKDHCPGLYDWFPPSAKLPEFCNTLTLSKSDPNVVNLLAQVTNHVAYVTDLACPVDRLIHVSSKFNCPSTASDLNRLLSKLSLPQFDAVKHDRRLAILGFALDTQVALVPASTKRGDLVLSIDPGSFPIIISPLLDDDYDFSSQFIPQMTKTSWPIATPAIRRRRSLAIIAFFFSVLTLFILIWQLLAPARHCRLVLIGDSNTSGEAVCLMVYIGLLVIFVIAWIVSCRMAVEKCGILLKRNLAKLDAFTNQHDCSYRFVGPALVQHGGYYRDLTAMDWKSHEERGTIMDISLAARPWQKFALR